MVPFVAGFGGIATRQWNRTPLVGWTAAGLAAVYAGMLAYWLPKGKFHDYERSVVDTEAEVMTAPIETEDPHQAEIARERMVGID
jgi:hypothetical protein